MQKICFIGHRLVLAENEVRKRLKVEITNQIKKGCKVFTMGTHGDFDKFALSVCRELRKRYKDIKIEVALTSMIQEKYEDADTVVYDIEEKYFKQRITSSNQQMIDTCNTLICYVNESYRQSGAKTAFKYAKKQGLNIINIYNDIQDIICKKDLKQ